MATASAADAWQQNGMRPDRPLAASRPGRPMGGPGPDPAARGMRPSVPQRGRTHERGLPPDRPRSLDRDPRYSGDAEYTRAPAPRRSGEPGRPAGRGPERGRPAERRPSGRIDGPRDGAPRDDPGASRRRPTPAPAAGQSRLRGSVAVLGAFLVTLAGAGIDSFVGIGLGLITLVALVASVCVATLVVRRRDVLSVVVSPPLVFVAVAMVNIGLAPSAPFNLPTLATLLIRGFPTMAVATAAALVLGLVRLVSKR